MPSILTSFLNLALVPAVAQALAIESPTVDVTLTRRGPSTAAAVVDRERLLRSK